MHGAIFESESRYLRRMICGLGHPRFGGDVAEVLALRALIGAAPSVPTLGGSGDSAVDGGEVCWFFAGGGGGGEGTVPRNSAHFEE